MDKKVISYVKALQGRFPFRQMQNTSSVTTKYRLRMFNLLSCRALKFSFWGTFHYIKHFPIVH